MDITKAELKELIRETMLDVLKERESWLEEVISDTIIDLKFGQAIAEGDTDEFVSEEEIQSKLIP